MTSTPRHSPLIRAQDLALLQGSPDILVVDCRFELANTGWGREAWQQGHIPEAAYAHLDDALSGPKYPGSGRHPLPSPEAFARTLGSWGFTDSTRVIAYDQGNGAHAARLWWLLRARGHNAVKILDGGFAAWTAAGLPISRAPPASVQQDVEPLGFAGAWTTQEVQAGLTAGRITLVDARGADRFAGRNETIDPVAGHVPGAVNQPFSGNLGADGKFLPADAMQRRWQPLLAQAATAPIVAMCGSGVTACHNLVALELAGHTGAQLYAGSFSEWIADPARPVTTGE
jgi:thiosulfate/3-mercaptopyruvate sulfurtransferase